MKFHFQSFQRYCRSTIQALNYQATCRYFTCSKTMPGSLGHEEQDAKTFASWVTTENSHYQVLIKSNFLLFFFFFPFLFIIHLPGERSLMYIDLLGRGLTIWSMIIATMVTLSQLLGNVISTNINQSVTSFLKDEAAACSLSFLFQISGHDSGANEGWASHLLLSLWMVTIPCLSPTQASHMKLFRVYSHLWHFLSCFVLQGRPAPCFVGR